MNEYFSKFVIVVIGLAFLPACTNIPSFFQPQKDEKFVTPKKNGPIEIIISKEELAAMGQWKKNNESYEITIKDAFNGDKAALYMIGMSYLTGMPSDLFTIDVRQADQFFSQSASLNFGPALNQIFHSYLEQGNVFLSFVYLNLVIASGHSEFLMSYHDMRTKMNDQGPLSIYNEIERIARHKKKTILKNQEELSKTTDEKDKFMFFYSKMTNITDEDMLFNNNYWQKALKGNAPENLEKWLREKYSLIIEKKAENAQKALNEYK